MIMFPVILVRSLVVRFVLAVVVVVLGASVKPALMADTATRNPRKVCLDFHVHLPDAIIPRLLALVRRRYTK